MIVRVFAIALVSLGLCLAQAAARGLSQAERESLPGAVESFRQALQDQDVVTIMSFLPPLVTAGMAERMGMTVPGMIAALTEKTAETGGLVTVESIAFDLDAAEPTESADGEPYLLIPTEIVVTFPGTGTVRHRLHTLAFPEAGRWRLLRLGSDEKRILLKMTYPQFADVDLPGSTAERLP